MNTAYTRELADRLHGGLAHARVCWLGTERDDMPAPAGGDGPPTVLILSRIDAGGGYKGHRELVEAWPSVTSAVPDARLLIAGDGPGSAIVAECVQRSPARAQIELCGHVPEDRIEALWSRATLFAMPGRREGFGLAYIEAMRHRVPVVASIHDAAPEINLDSVTGYNVDLGRRDELAERLIHLLKDRDHARALGQAGHARWREHFTFAAFRRRFSVILDELLAQ